MKNIGVIGTGNIGKCLVRLMCNNNVSNHLTVSDRNEKVSSELEDNFNVARESNRDTIELSDILFLTVKPNNIKEICREVNKYTHEGSRARLTIVSVASGVPIDMLNKWTLGKHDIVRCMPNIPIGIDEGSILWYGDENFDDKEYKFITSLTEGPHNVRVDREDLIDAGTIISGCSPAYLAKIYGIYADIGKDLGFTDEQSKQLLHRSFTGTMKLLLDNNYTHIMKQVASEGGSTEKGLEILEKGGIHDLIKDSVYCSMLRIKNIRKNLD